MIIGKKIISYSSLSSTMDMARELALRGEAEGTVILADEQTKGRGTKGRWWYSAPGMGFYASVILRPSREEISLLPLLAGVAVREALVEAYKLEIYLKWPNDLIFQRKKLGGLLLESEFFGSALSYVILGVGINFNHETKDFPPELRERAISLRIGLGYRLSPEAWQPFLWDKLNFWYPAFLEKKDEMIIKEFEAHHFWPRGKMVEVDNGIDVYRGRFVGFNLSGALLLTTPEGLQALTTGELSPKED
ncbi:MAG: biotin--[acetyl-CoA-carboxylase] ligase [Candidatus Aminicenantales bacterium]